MAQRTPGFALFTDPDGRFSVEFPSDWRWMMVSPSQEALVTFVQPRSEAALVVERVRLKQSLANDEITELFAQIESDILKENQPKATDVAAKMIVQGGRRIVVIDYTRPGLVEDERVRQYSFPVVENLYRVTCMALAREFKKYEMTFASVADSLKSAGELGTTSARGR
jgi:PsbP